MEQLLVWRADRCLDSGEDGSIIDHKIVGLQPHATPEFSHFARFKVVVFDGKSCSVVEYLQNVWIGFESIQRSIDRFLPVVLRHIVADGDTTTAPGQLRESGRFDD